MSVSYLYVHIPFCLRKCHYCAFDSRVADQALFSPYVDALQRELRLTMMSHQLSPQTSLFFGGGTPTVIPTPLLCDLVTTTLGLVSPSPGIEVTIEANPGTVDLQSLRSLLAAGVNRLSLGVQSLADDDLRSLGRVHDAEQALRVYREARKAGFTNINLDLMYGLPGQTRERWRAVLTTALNLEPEHLSIYQLTPEEGTPLWQQWSQGNIALAADEEVAAMDEITEELCTGSGLLPYEISNYARQGRECRHNCNYWMNGEYYAVGAAAVSCVYGKRERRVADPRDYIELVARGQSPVIEEETLPFEESFRESVVMALRLRSGAELERLRSRYGIDVFGYYGEILQTLVARDLLEITATHIRLTALGRRFANIVMGELV